MNRYLVIVKRDVLNLLRSLVKVLVNLEINLSIYQFIELSKFRLKIVVTYNDVHLQEEHPDGRFLSKQ
jgi:hypothetical protein